jgi:aspartyl-tRNA synthetase
MMKKNIYHSLMIENINSSLIGEEVVVSGWIQNIRDHGGVLFLDLRDNTDILQVVSNDDNIFKGLAKESVIKVIGIIRKRDIETYNPNIKTGEVELLISDLEILSTSLHILPFEIISSKQVNEEIRLKYRYLDLRNDKVKDNTSLFEK